MTIQVTIIGLGRLGTSLGLALSAQPDLRLTGHDRSQDQARIAQSRSAVRRIEWNLLNAVDKAEVVLVCAPLAEQREILQAILPELREGCVLALVGALLGPPLAWTAELRPAGDRHVVACHPVLSPAQLHSGEAGVNAADAGLFRGGLWALAPAPGCAPEALKLVTDLVRLLDAFPYYVEPNEHDGLVAATEALPAILAWALLQAAAASPGWPEARKLADRGLATATAALDDPDPAALRLNRVNVLRYLDAATAELQALRERLAADDGPSLQQALAAAAERRAAWLADRRRGDWEALDQPAVDMPTPGETMGRMFVGGLARRKPKGEG